MKDKPHTPHGRKEFLKILKIAVGILISVVFLLLAFQRVDWGEMRRAFAGIRWFYASMITVLILISHWLRAIRWRYFLAPIRTIDTGGLFTALIIGYAANTILPAHLGEILRAYVIGKKRDLPASAVFATIVTERILDMLSLLGLILFALFIYPFPESIKKSAWILFLGTMLLLAFMVVLKKRSDKTLGWIRSVLKPLPQKGRDRVDGLLRTFLSGLVRFRRPSHYAIVAALTAAIWLCYGTAFWFGFRAFQFDLPWTAPLVLLVITTIGIIIPSSPGYVGTYHWLCQFGLGLYDVPKSPALAFAIVLHGLNILPVFLLGLVLAWKEGISLIRNRDPLQTNQPLKTG